MFKRFFTVPSNVAVTFDPSNPRIAGVLAKVDRALEHVKALDDWHDGWTKTQPYSLTPNLDAQGRANSFNFRITNPIPVSTGLIIGDIIHNLRTALDHLAGAVAVKNGNTARRTYFVIVHDVSILPSQLCKKMGDCPESFRDFVRDQHPYKGGNDALYALHQIDILDKHQAIIPAGVGIDVKVGADRGFYGIFDFSKVKEKIRVPLPQGQSFIKSGETKLEFGTAFYFPDKTKIEASVTPAIVFGEETPIPGYEVRSALMRMLEAVYSIIHHAEPLFLR